MICSIAPIWHFQTYNIVKHKYDFKNIISLFTAGKPKKNNALKSLCLMLGPDFISDIIEVNIFVVQDF